MSRKEAFLLRSVIKEELVILTKHRDEAAILQQFLYWTPRSKNYDQFLIEETIRMKQQDLKDFDGGWIYKTAEELKNELLMIDTNVKTVRKYLKNLVEKGFLLRRKNPEWKVDRTYQYRINLRKLVNEVNNIGHHVEGFEQFSLNIKTPPVFYLYNREKGHWIGTDLSVSNNLNDTLNNDILDVEAPKTDFPNGKMSATIPEFTSKISNKEQLSKNTLEMNDDYNVIVNKFLSISRKEFVSKEDQQLISEVMLLVNDVSMIVSLMDNCYKLKNDLDSRGAAGGESASKTKGIWSFKYIRNYILREFDESNGNKKTHAEDDLREGNQGVFGESDSKADDGGWVGDTKCNF